MTREELRSALSTDICCFFFVQVLLSVPLCLLCLPLSVQRAVQQPGPGHLVAVHPGEMLLILLRLLQPHMGAGAIL